MYVLPIERGGTMDGTLVFEVGWQIAIRHTSKRKHADEMVRMVCGSGVECCTYND